MLVTAKIGAQDRLKMKIKKLLLWSLVSAHALWFIGTLSSYQIAILSSMVGAGFIYLLIYKFAYDETL